jgi:hypothetical protein
MDRSVIFKKPQEGSVQLLEQKSIVDESNFPNMNEILAAEK